MFNFILDSSVGKFYQFVNCWGGYDKHEKGLLSWELPLSLISFLLEKFGYNSDYDTSVLETYYSNHIK